MHEITFDYHGNKTHLKMIFLNFIFLYILGFKKSKRKEISFEIRNILNRLHKMYMDRQTKNYYFSLKCLYLKNVFQIRLC